jgi:hypothetical protein
MQADWDITCLRGRPPVPRSRCFFNDAGAWLQPRAVVARVIEHLRLGGQRGGYGMRANRRIWKGGAKSTTRTSIPHRARSSRLLAWSNTW